MSIFSFPSVYTYVLGAQRFWLRNKKNIFIQGPIVIEFAVYSAIRYTKNFYQHSPFSLDVFSLTNCPVYCVFIALPHFRLILVVTFSVHRLTHDDKTVTLMLPYNVGDIARAAFSLHPCLWG